MGQVVTLPVELIEINCGECGGTYAINSRYRRQKEEKGGYWNCPYCKCSWGYGQSENERLRKQLDAEKAAKQRALTDANETREALNKAERSVIRLKNRAKNGVCPCCHRTFKQLAQHMKTKHPKYK